MWWSYGFEYHLQQWWLTAELCCSGKAQLLLRQLAKYCIAGKPVKQSFSLWQSLLKEAQLFPLTIKEDTCFFALSTFLWRTAPMPNPKAFLGSTTFHSHCSVLGLPWLQRTLNSRHIPFSSQPKQIAPHLLNKATSPVEHTTVSQRMNGLHMTDVSHITQGLLFGRRPKGLWTGENRMHPRWRNVFNFGLWAMPLLAINFICNLMRSCWQVCLHSHLCSLAHILPLPYWMLSLWAPHEQG